MKYKKSPLLPLLATLLVAFMLYACDWPVDTGGDRERPPQTRILEVRVQPDTVAPGDTARFTCIIEDSTDERFEFFWYVDEGEVLDVELFDEMPIVYKTEINTIQWVAPEQPNFHSFTVLASNGSEDSVSVDKSFVIIVE